MDAGYPRQFSDAAVRSLLISYSGLI